MLLNTRFKRFVGTSGGVLPFGGLIPRITGPYTQPAGVTVDSASWGNPGGTYRMFEGTQGIFGNFLPTGYLEMTFTFASPVTVQRIAMGFWGSTPANYSNKISVSVDGGVFTEYLTPLQGGTTDGIRGGVEYCTDVPTNKMIGTTYTVRIYTPHGPGGILYVDEFQMFDQMRGYGFDFNRTAVYPGTTYGRNDAYVTEIAGNAFTNKTSAPVYVTLDRSGNRTGIKVMEFKFSKSEYNSVMVMPISDTSIDDRSGFVHRLTGNTWFLVIFDFNNGGSWQVKSGATTILSGGAGTEPVFYIHSGVVCTINRGQMPATFSTGYGWL